jgi:hypothetical protein
MSIMQKLRRRDPQAGYAADFVKLMKRIGSACQKGRIKVVTNAGGVNPRACRAAVKEVLAQLGLHGMRIAVVEGDDLLPRLETLIANGHPLQNMDDGRPLAPILDRVQSANVYLGAAAMADALAQGADIVIAGRVTDPALVVAPCIREFGWSMTQTDQLAAATVAGHIIECGSQCTGANYVRWRDVPDMARIGYPVVECHPDGSFIVTKQEKTGGLVNRETVISQLVYEMGDPKRFITADCIVDFTTIQLAEDGHDRVRIWGIRGAAPTNTYKVSISYLDGYKVVGQLTIAGPNAIEKAQLCAQIIFERAAMAGVDISQDQRLVELLGTNVCHAGIVQAPRDPAEVVLRVGARGDDRESLDRLGMEIVPLVTSGPPGITGYAGGRPKATEVISYWPALIARDQVSTSVDVEEVP